MAGEAARASMDGVPVGYPDAVESHTAWMSMTNAAQMLASLPDLAIPDRAKPPQLEYEMLLLFAAAEAPHRVWPALLASYQATAMNRAGLARTDTSTMRAALDAHQLGHAAAAALDALGDALVVVWVMERASSMKCLQADLLPQARDAVLVARGMVHRVLFAAEVSA